MKSNSDFTETGSGRKFIEILKQNSRKEPFRYEESDLDDIRKVVSYCKRHLTPKKKAKQDSKSKSHMSLEDCMSISEPFLALSILDRFSRCQISVCVSYHLVFIFKN